MSTKKKFPTRCVHEGEIKDTMYQGIVSPLFMSTTYPWFGGDAEKKPYPRSVSYTHLTLPTILLV